MQGAYNKYHINIENEISFWQNNIINKRIEIGADLKCPNCNNKSLKLFRNSKSLSNPYILKCNKKECRKKLNLREGTFFGLHKKNSYFYNNKNNRIIYIT